MTIRRTCIASGSTRPSLIKRVNNCPGTSENSYRMQATISKQPTIVNCVRGTTATSTVWIGLNWIVRSVAPSWQRRREDVEIRASSPNERRRNEIPFFCLSVSFFFPFVVASTKRDVRISLTTTNSLSGRNYECWAVFHPQSRGTYRLTKHRTGTLHREMDPGVNGGFQRTRKHLQEMHPDFLRVVKHPDHKS